MNPNPLNQWSRRESIARVWIDGEKSWTLLDSGSTINALTPDFVDIYSLDISPLSNLSEGTLGINGFGGVFSWPLGYVIQVKGVWAYDEDQVALVVPDSTGLWSQYQLLWVHPPSIGSSM